MATRSGSVDPGLLTWWEQTAHLSPAELAHALEHESGLLGLAGTGDMEELLRRDDPAASLALDVYLHRLAGSIATMTVALGGLDVLLFTGAVGEHAPVVRQLTAARLGHLGVVVDTERNHVAVPDCEIGGSGAAVRTLVVTAREDLQIARGVEELLAAAVPS